VSGLSRPPTDFPSPFLLGRVATAAAMWSSQ